jgi:hypothetical protein
MNWSMIGRLGRIISALLAVTIMTVVVPSALVMMGRWRFGSAHPWAGLRSSTFTDFPALLNTAEAVLRGQLTDQMLVDVMLRVVLVAGWACVVILVVSVLTELVHQVRGDEPNSRAARGFGWSQGIARSIAAGLLLILPMHGVAGAQMSSGEAFPTAVVHSVADALSVPHSVVAVGPDLHVVTSNETLWEIAERTLGDPLRWTEIWSMNKNQTMVDGRVFEDPHVIIPGWVLQIPAGRAPAVVEPGSLPASVLDGQRSDTDYRNLAPGTTASYGEDRESRDDPTRWEGQDLIGLDFDVINDGLVNPGTVTVLASTSPTEGLVTRANADRRSNDSDGDHSDADQEVQTVLEEEASNDLLVRLGSATMLATGIVAGLAARRRRRLRSSTSQMRPVPLDRLLMDQHLGRHDNQGGQWFDGTDSEEDPFGHDEDLSEFADGSLTMGLQMAESSQRLLRLDLVLRIVAVPLIRQDQAIAVVFMDDRGDIEIVATGEVVLERPFRGEGRHWVMSAQVALDRLIEMAQGLDYPSPALVHLGNDGDGRELYVDLEVIGVLSVIDDRLRQAHSGRNNSAQVSDVLRAMHATLAHSLFGHALEQYWVGPHLGGTRLTTDSLGSQQVAHCEDFGELVQVVSAAPSQKLRVAVVSGGLRLSDAPAELWMNEMVVVGCGEVPTTGARLRAQRDHWVLDGPVLEDLQLVLFPVGLSASEATALADLIEEESEQPVLVYEVEHNQTLTAHHDPQTNEDIHGAEVLSQDAAFQEHSREVFDDPGWSLMVRVMGTVDVVDYHGTAARFERSKSLELLAWCVTHRGRSTRSAARTSMWELNVRDATFANVVSEARRATSALVPTPKNSDWLQRTLTEELLLDPGVVSDAEIMRRALNRVDRHGVAQVVDEVEAAVALIRGMPCEASNYLWPEAEGISSDLILVATSLAASLALHRLAEGDVQGVFRATAAGLLALPGHEELIALRMRAHGAAGDLAGVKQEWAAYQRVIARDPWSSGEPAPKLRELSSELLGLEV